jgi:hypothetical protein
MLMYTMTTDDNQYGCFADFSADGVHWKQTADYVDPREGDTTTLMEDPTCQERYGDHTRRHSDGGGAQAPSGMSLRR